MTTPPIVLVLPNAGVGGAEKRLTEVWLHLAPRTQNLRLIVRKSTFDQLCVRPDLKRLESFADRVTLIETDAGSFPSTLLAFAPVLWRLPRGSVVHHLLQAPPLLHRLRGHRLLVSWVATQFPQPKRSLAKFNDWLLARLSLAQADRVDVLNPEMLEFLGGQRALSGKSSMTVGGTIVDGAEFKPADKRDEVVFLGRIEKFKNALAFVEALPAIDAAVRAKGKTVAFRLYGRSADQGDVVRRLLYSGPYKSLDVAWTTTDRPASVLAPAKVFVSLQSPSNYPSKALAEAMAAGCVPVISDSGQSRLMADDRLASYVPERFGGGDLAHSIAAILALDDAAFTKRSRAVREMALERFRVDPQANYFAKIYGALAGERR